MKKLLISLGAAALLAGSLASCGKGSAISAEEKAANDSVAGLFGLVVGSQFAENLQRSPELDREAFIRGVSTAMLADTADQGYIMGLQQGARIAQQLQYFYQEFGIDADRDIFMKEFKRAILSDTVVNTMLQQAELNALIEKAQQRAQQRREEALNNSPEAIAGRQAGQAYIDSLKAADPAVKTTASGLSYKVISEGEGQPITDDDMVAVIYKGQLIDGTVFDNSNGEARTFSPRRVVPGFGEGLRMMKKGAKYVLYIPGDLAYGVNGQPAAGIGPNAMLVFDVEIADVNARK